LQCVLDLLRVRGTSDGALRGVITVHGILEEYVPDEQRASKHVAPKQYPPVLVLHGNADPFVPEGKVQAFREEMADRGVPLNLVAFDGATHAFTRPEKVPGTDTAAYNEPVAQDAWSRMESFVATTTAAPHRPPPPP